MMSTTEINPRHRARTLIAATFALWCFMLGGCGPSNVYSWKPQAASLPRQRTKPAPVVVPASADQVGASILEEAYLETKVTWVAVPTPDGKKTRWIRVE